MHQLKNVKQQLVLVACLGMGLAGCATTVTKMAFSYYDKDKDGLISYEEYSAGSETDKDYIEGAKAAGQEVSEYVRAEFDEMDANADGLLTQDEMKQDLTGD